MKHSYIYFMLFSFFCSYSMESDKKFQAAVEDVKEQSTVEIYDAFKDIAEKRSHQIGSSVLKEFNLSVSNPCYKLTSVAALELELRGLVKPGQETVAPNVRDLMIKMQAKQKQTEGALGGLERLMQSKK